MKALLLLVSEIIITISDAEKASHSLVLRLQFTKPHISFEIFLLWSEQVLGLLICQENVINLIRNGYIVYWLWIVCFWKRLVQGHVQVEVLTWYKLTRFLWLAIVKLVNTCIQIYWLVSSSFVHYYHHKVAVIAVVLTAYSGWVQICCKRYKI